MATAEAERAADARRFYEWLRVRLERNIALRSAGRRHSARDQPGRPAGGSVGGRSSPDRCRECRSEGGPESLCPSGAPSTCIWQREGVTGVKGALQVAHGFLGLRLECAQCHRHPHDVWQQDDLLSFANFFTRISEPRNGPKGMVGSTPDLVQMSAELADEAKRLQEQVKILEKWLGDKKLKKKQQDLLRKEANAAKTRANKATSLANRLRLQRNSHPAVADPGLDDQSRWAPRSRPACGCSARPRK